MTYDLFNGRIVLKTVSISLFDKKDGVYPVSRLLVLNGVNSIEVISLF